MRMIKVEERTVTEEASFYGALVDSYDTLL